MDSLKGWGVAFVYDCELLSGEALSITWGINEGGCLGALSEAALGDIYTLQADIRPLEVSLTIDQLIRVATVTGAKPLGPLPGSRVLICGEMRFMSADGELVAALLLQAGSFYLLLPLNPMRAGTGYALISVDDSVTALRMSELVTGCFASGARVTLGDGNLCAVDALEIGMQIRTRDHGPQPLRWIGRVTKHAHGSFAPVTFPAGSIGNLGALSVGPLQRIFLYQRGEDRLGTRPEVLVQAQYLVDGRRVLQRDVGFVDYFSLVFDDHQIIYVEGIPVESMLVSRATVDRLPETLAQDLSRRFPLLNQHAHFAQDISLGRITSDQRAAILRDKEK